MTKARPELALARSQGWFRADSGRLEWRLRLSLLKAPGPALSDLNRELVPCLCDSVVRNGTRKVERGIGGTNVRLDQPVIVPPKRNCVVEFQIQNYLKSFLDKGFMKQKMRSSDKSLTSVTMLILRQEHISCFYGPFFPKWLSLRKENDTRFKIIRTCYNCINR